MAPPNEASRIASFVDELNMGVRSKPGEAPVVFRSLGTILRRCGRRRLSMAFLAELMDSLATVGLHHAPSLIQSRLTSKDRIAFSTAPFPATRLLFESESSLRSFVLASIGKGAFDRLALHRENGKVRCNQYSLPSKKRIDLLCDEVVRSGPSPLVAIEFKRVKALRVVPQLVEYMRELSEVFPDRPVKGIVILGDSDPMTSELRDAFRMHDITIYRYHIEFIRAD